MNYFIKRDDKEYGPYTLADLQRYVKSGEISPSDLCRSEGMIDLLPVSQIVGNIPAPQPLPTSYGGAEPGMMMPVATPPNLHWGLVLLFGILTCGIFFIIWIFIQAAFVKKIDPKSKAQQILLIYLLVAIGLPIGMGITAALTHNQLLITIEPLLRIAGFILFVYASFNMASSLEDYYNSREPMGLHLSGVMVFFFNCVYFQYHFNEITKRHNNPQGMLA